MLIHVPFKIRLLNCIERFHKTISCEDMLKRWVMTDVHFLCLVQVTRIYIEVEETLLSFVLASKCVPRCKEEAVLYKRMDRFCAKLYNLTVRSVQTHKSL